MGHVCVLDERPDVLADYRPTNCCHSGPPFAGDVSGAVIGDYYEIDLPEVKRIVKRHRRSKRIHDYALYLRSLWMPATRSVSGSAGAMLANGRFAQQKSLFKRQSSAAQTRLCVIRQAFLGLGTGPKCGYRIAIRASKGTPHHTPPDMSRASRPKGPFCRLAWQRSHRN